MLVLTYHLAIFALAALFCARWILDHSNVSLARTIVGNIFGIVAGILGISFCVLLIITHWNLFTVPKILLFISGCLFVLFKEPDEECIPFCYGISVTIIAFIHSFFLAY